MQMSTTISNRKNKHRYLKKLRKWFNIIVSRLFQLMTRIIVPTDEQIRMAIGESIKELTELGEPMSDKLDVLKEKLKTQPIDLLVIDSHGKFVYIKYELSGTFYHYFARIYKNAGYDSLQKAIDASIVCKDEVDMLHKKINKYRCYQIFSATIYSKYNVYYIDYGDLSEQ